MSQLLLCAELSWYQALQTSPCSHTEPGGPSLPALLLESSAQSPGNSKAAALCLLTLISYPEAQGDSLLSRSLRPFPGRITGVSVTLILSLAFPTVCSGAVLGQAVRLIKDPQAPLSSKNHRKSQQGQQQSQPRAPIPPFPKQHPQHWIMSSKEHL